MSHTGEGANEAAGSLLDSRAEEEVQREIHVNSTQRATAHFAFASSVGSGPPVVSQEDV